MKITSWKSCLYLIEVFIYDKANFFEKKIEIDIHHDINMDYFHLNTINFSLNDYLCNEIWYFISSLFELFE